MSIVAKHYRELERECDNTKYGWIDFSVHWDSICIRYFLVDESYVVCLEESGWVNQVVVVRVAM